MKDYIPVDELLKEADKMGIDLGKGDPYNRLRYYTKMGWIPHMVRKKGTKGGTKGHYPRSTLDRLVLIQKMKDQGMTNEEISSKLAMKDKVSNFYSIIKSNEIRNKVITYATFIMIVAILLVEIGYIEIGNSRENLDIISSQPGDQIQVADVGTAFVPEGETLVFVKSNRVFDNSKIHVTFKDDYSPATKFWVGEQRAQEGFVVELDSPVLSSAEFDWWISNN